MIQDENVVICVTYITSLAPARWVKSPFKPQLDRETGNHVIDRYLRLNIMPEILFDHTS